MEPAFQRGDILFLNNQDDPIRVGEIVVFKIKDRDIPIVHRVLEVHEKYVGIHLIRVLGGFWGMDGWIGICMTLNGVDRMVGWYGDRQVHPHAHMYLHAKRQPPNPPPTHTNRSDGRIELLTKGDNNRVGDRGLYAPGQLWLNREDILGRAAGTLRYLGMVTIILNDYPMLKCVAPSVGLCDGCGFWWMGMGGCVQCF